MTEVAQTLIILALAAAILWAVLAVGSVIQHRFVGRAFRFHFHIPSPAPRVDCRCRGGARRHRRKNERGA